MFISILGLAYNIYKDDICPDTTIEPIRDIERSHLSLVLQTRLADPDSIGSVDPDPDSESGSRRAKMTNKSRIK